MPRRPRLLIDGAYYHVLTRGNDKKKIFRRQKDYRYFLNIMREYLLKFPVGIVHYCLMPNHVHLLVYAHLACNLPKFMQGVLMVYAYYFRKQYAAEGFVFQNRYKSKLIEDERYLLDCGRYIERNPVRAQIVASPEEYPWSSCGFYAKGEKNNLITAMNPIYSEFGAPQDQRQKKYQDYVLQSMPFEHIVDKEFAI